MAGATDPWWRELKARLPRKTWQKQTASNGEALELEAKRLHTAMAKWRNASSNERMTMLENIRRKLLFGDGDHEQRQKLLRVVLRKVVASMSAPRHHVAGKRRQECQAETEPAGPSQQDCRELSKIFDGFG